MSVRIYQLSKEIGVDNSELIQILRARGHEVKSASSTVDNISADSIRAEYAAQGKAKAESEARASAEAEEKKAKAAAPVAQQPKAPQQVHKSPEPPAAKAPEAAVETTGKTPVPAPEAKQAPATPAPQVPVSQPHAAGAAPSVPPPLPMVNRAPQPTRSAGTPPPAIPGRVPPPIVQPRGAGHHYSGPPSRDVTAAAHNAPSTLPNIADAMTRNTRPEQPGSKPPSIQPPAARDDKFAQTAEQAHQKPAGMVAPTGPQPLRAPSIPGRLASQVRPASTIPQRAPSISAPQSAQATPPSIPAIPARNAPQTGAPAAAEPSPEAAAPKEPGKGRVLLIKPPIVVRDFAVQIGLKPFQLISELMEMNIFASMNQALDNDVAKRIAARHNIELDIHHRGETQTPAQVVEKKTALPVRKAELTPRPPIVCILGHVDHGKTTLLDTIRKAHVAAGEAGGITQHIGAYQITHKEKKITFIDTPGHAAFSNMRARGANVTDIAVLVVAADDGFMPQTDEALGHARYAKVPIVVAINKMDMPGADIEKVRRQLQERELTPEEWGGDTLAIPVSALKGDGIPALLDAILLQAEITEGISADYKASPTGVVLESQKEMGVGPTASAIIEEGTLRRGDALVCGPHYCRVRTLIDDKGQQIKEATPGTPVKIVGWASTPESGDSFHTVENERAAKEEAEENAHRLKLEQVHAEAETQHTGPANIDDLFAAIAHAKSNVYRVVVKADVYGTAEALAVALQQIKSEKIKLEVVEMGVGAVSKNDILMASAAQAAIVAFNINLENGSAAFAKHHNIKLFQHNIIYELIDQIKDAMRDELPAETRENKIGAAEIRQLFPVTKGLVAGAMVTEGRIARSAPIARLVRKGKLLHESKISTLRRFKDDASEVRAGYECGLQLDNCNDYQVGDLIECYEILKIKAQL
jgi:translation initiation factor IF-2